MNTWIVPYRDLPHYLKSLTDGFCPHLQAEHLLRAKAARFIFQAGVDLQLTQCTIATACTFMHRFYLRKSFKDYVNYVCCVLQVEIGYDMEIAAASLFLACKVEETLRRTQDIVKVIIRVALKNPNISIDIQGKEFKRWSEIILNLEDALLRNTCFDLYIQHPYVLLDHMLSSLIQADLLHEQDHIPVHRLAWLWMNDSYRSPVCITHDIRTIAGAALCLAAKGYLIEGGIQTDWQEFLWIGHLHLESSQVEEAKGIMQSVYKMPDIIPTLEVQFELHHLHRRMDMVGENVDDRRAVALASFSQSNPSIVVASRPTSTSVELEEGELDE